MALSDRRAPTTSCGGPPLQIKPGSQSLALCISPKHQDAIDVYSSVEPLAGTRHRRDPCCTHIVLESRVNILHVIHGL